MENNNRNKNQQTDSGINLVDILLYLLSYWKWYLLALMVCLGLAYYKYITTGPTFFSSVDVMINDPSEKSNNIIGLDRYNSAINAVNVANEMHMLQSKELLEKMVQNTHADLNFTIRIQLYQGDMYGREPVDIVFYDSLQVRSASFTMRIQDEEYVLLSDFTKDGPTYRVPLDSIVQTPAGRMKISLTEKFDDSWINLETHVTKYPIESVVRKYHNAISIRQDDESASILTLALQDDSYRRAQAVLKGLIDVYNTDALESKNSVSVNTAKFLEDRIEVIGQELGGVDAELADYKRRNKILNPSSSAQIYADESHTYSNEQVDKEIQLRMAQSMKDYLDNPANVDNLIPSNVGLEGAGIESQITSINNLIQQYHRLGGEKSEGNPVVVELKNNIMVQRAILQNLMVNYISILRSQLDDLVKKEQRATYRMGEMPQKESEILSIERQLNIKDALYSFLLNKREENALSQAMVAYNARIIDSSDGDEAPISPNRNKLLFLGLVAGLAIPTLILLIRLFLDTRVHSRKDLEGVLTVPFLGEIPYDKTKSIVEALVKDEDFAKSRSVINEAIRVIRTNIAFMNKEKNGAQVIMFTSFLENSGKTFIAAHLAKSLTLADRKVLIIDMDIRKRTLTDCYDLLDVKGVSDYLANHLDVDKILYHNEEGLADFIPAGRLAPNPSELLMKSRLEEMIQQVSSQYDYVLIDNVPMGGIADAKIVNRIADLTVFIIRAGNIDRRQLPDVERLYQEKTLNNMAIILNGSEMKPAYGYRYGYGYGYGYGHYGYYYGKDGKKHKHKKHKE